MKTWQAHTMPRRAISPNMRHVVVAARAATVSFATLGAQEARAPQRPLSDMSPFTLLAQLVAVRNLRGTLPGVHCVRVGRDLGHFGLERSGTHTVAMSPRRLWRMELLPKRRRRLAARYTVIALIGRISLGNPLVVGDRDPTPSGIMLRVRVRLQVQICISAGRSIHPFVFTLAALMDLVPAMLAALTTPQHHHLIMCNIWVGP